MLQPASGEAATADANLQVALGFTAISGPKATLISDGATNLDHPSGLSYKHCEGSSINISSTGIEARAITAQYVIEYTCVRSHANHPNRWRLSGETQHEVPDVVRNIVEGNWMAPVPHMQLGLRIIRVVAI
eukprot:5362450-Pyramimonas_sp.AAC.1